MTTESSILSLAPDGLNNLDKGFKISARVLHWNFAKRHLDFDVCFLVCSENVIQKTAAGFTICICEEFSHNMNSFDQILGRVSQFFHLVVSIPDRRKNERRNR